VSFSGMALSSLRSVLFPIKMEEQSSSDFSCTSWIQYFYIPAFFTLGTLETVLVGEVEYDQDSVRFLEIVFCQGKEFLLARCIPYAKRNLIIFQSDYLFL
jgi:hypothetical protein